MNIGEESEHYLKAFLLKRRDEKISDTIFGNIEDLSDDGNLSELTWNTQAEPFLQSYDITRLVDILGIAKARTLSKADVAVNGVRYSLKEIGASPPAIVNHTARPGFETACKHVGVSIKKLDDIISDYWKLRQRGIIKEDTKTSDPNCPFKLYKDYLKPIIEYFLFTGTGSGVSNFPADKVLEINYRNLPAEMRIFEKDDYFDQVWDRLQLSIRSKGMPPNYPDCKNADSISKWTNVAEGKHKGSLHIRVN